MWLVIIQFFIMFIVCASICSYIILGVANKINSKLNKNWIYLVGVIIMLTIMTLGVLCVMFVNEKHIYVWYGLTLATIILSNIVLLNMDTELEEIENPLKLKDYLYNEKCEYFKKGFGKFLIKTRYLIYVWYIVLTILNQIGDLGTNMFSNVLYLKVNEYSLIVLFAINEIVKILKKDRK